MATQEVANELVKLCSEGKFHEAIESAVRRGYRQHGSWRAPWTIA